MRLPRITVIASSERKVSTFRARISAEAGDAIGDESRPTHTEVLASTPIEMSIRERKAASTVTDTGNSNGTISQATGCGFASSRFLADSVSNRLLGSKK